MTYPQFEPPALLCFILVGTKSLINLMEGSLLKINLNVLTGILRVIHTNDGYSFMWYFEDFTCLLGDRENALAFASCLILFPVLLLIILKSRHRARSLIM